MAYSPKLKNPNHPDLVQAVRDGDENPIPALCALLQKIGQSRRNQDPPQVEHYQQQFVLIAHIAIGDKPEISFFYAGKLIFLSRESDQIVYQTSIYGSEKRGKAQVI